VAAGCGGEEKTRGGKIPKERFRKAKTLERTRKSKTIEEKGKDDILECIEVRDIGILWGGEKITAPKD